MGIYVTNFLLISLIAALSSYEEDKIQSTKNLLLTNLGLVVAAAQLILILTFRSDNVGIDTRGYHLRFIRYAGMSFAEIQQQHQELGFSLLIKLVSLLGGNFQWFLFVTSCIMIIPVVYIAGKYSPYPYLSILLFIVFDHYAFMFSGIRQGVAFGICIWSFKYIREKKFFKFLLLVLLAAMFHKSAYLFIPAYFVARIKVCRTTIIYLICMGILIFIFKRELYSFIESNLFRTTDNFYRAKDTGAYMWFTMTLIIAITCLLSVKNLDDSSNWTFNQFAMLTTAGAILMIFTMIGTNAKRVGEYYTAYSIYAIPMLINNIDRTKVRTFVSIVIGACVIGLFIWSMTNNQYYIVPYELYNGGLQNNG
jgi:hypothetical protein